jgi:antitoxin component YwqK of YwqJK toxin-antitoxin module
MKHLLVLIPFLLFTVATMAQDSLGFTNKTEAENKMANGLKEGKWVEYLDANKAYYALIIYKSGMRYGIVREYYESGKLEDEIPYTNGKINGVIKVYYESGNLESEDPWINGRINGVVKLYYEDGKLKSEVIWNDGKKGATKNYDENGNEIK